MFGILTYLLQHPTILLVLPILAALKEELVKGFTGRPSLVTNTAAIFVTTAVKWSTVPSFIQIYAIFGLVIGFVAFLSYMTNFRLNTMFYTISWFLYNSIFALVFPFVF